MNARLSTRQWLGPLAPLAVSMLLNLAVPAAHADPAARGVASSTAAVATASTSASASRHSGGDEHKRPMDAPFAFRGIPLGITLDEFRAGSTVRATPVGSVPVCETDMLAEALGMSLKTGESLTVACRWAHRTADRWLVSQAVVDGALAQDHVLRFRARQWPDARCVCTRFRLSSTRPPPRSARRAGGPLRSAAARHAEHVDGGWCGSCVLMGKRRELDHVVLFAVQPQRHAHLSAERSRMRG
jgi:hypothetical protein